MRLCDETVQNDPCMIHRAKIAGRPCYPSLLCVCLLILPSPRPRQGGEAGGFC
jgi:hypothetical protein